jgi:hypothetical protein
VQRAPPPASSAPFYARGPENATRRGEPCDNGLNFRPLADRPPILRPSPLSRGTATKDHNANFSRFPSICTERLTVAAHFPAA